MSVSRLRATGIHSFLQSPQSILRRPLLRPRYNARTMFTHRLLLPLRRRTTLAASPSSPLRQQQQCRTQSTLSPTVEWLRGEFVLACKIILFGSLGLLSIGGIVYLSLHAYLESESPTPDVYPHRARAALRVAHHAANWEGDIARAAKFLAEAVRRVEEQVGGLGGWAAAVGGAGKKSWKEGLRGYVAALERLAECEEKLGYSKNAAGRWRTLLRLGEEGGLGGVVDRKVRSRAAVKLGTLLDEVAGVELDEKGGGLAAPPTGGEKAEDEEAATRRIKLAAREAEGLFTLAYILACEDAGLPVPPAAEKPGVIPAGVPPERLTPELLHTATELGIHYARLKQLDLALPTFLSVLRARTSLPPRGAAAEEDATGDLADPCEVGKIHSYLGEVLWAAGQKGQGLEWSMRAVDATVPLVEQRAACRDCAVFAGGNVVMMLRRLLEEVEQKKTEKKEERAFHLWRRPGGGVGVGVSGSGGNGDSVEEWERQLGVAEEQLKRVLGVRVAKGK